MPEIIIISGKGGTGKTSLTAAFAHTASDAVICDLDVDAPDLHLILQPTIKVREDFYSGHEAVIDPEACTACGLCAEMCRFGAISSLETGYRVDPLKCEGCKVCVALCPADGDVPAGYSGHVEVEGLEPVVHLRKGEGQSSSSCDNQWATDFAPERASVVPDDVPCPFEQSLHQCRG